MTLHVSTLLIVFAALQAACGEKGKQFHIDEDIETSSSTQATATHGSVSSSLNSFYHSEKGWKAKVLYKIDEKATDDVVQAAGRAANTWNQAIGREVLSFGGRHDGSHGGGLYDSLNDDVTVIYLESNWLKTTQKKTSTLATTVWENNVGDAQIISKGDIIMNLENYIFVDSETVEEATDPRKAIADTETVILHEFGHLLGLNHIKVETDEDSVMLAYTLIGAQVYQRSLSDGDVERIRALYQAP